MCIASSIATRKGADHWQYFLLSASPSVLYASMNIDDREVFELTGQENEKRFGEAMSSEAVSAEIAGRVPKNTTHTTALFCYVMNYYKKIKKISKRMLGCEIYHWSTM